MLPQTQDTTYNLQQPHPLFLEFEIRFVNETRSGGALLIRGGRHSFSVLIRNQELFLKVFD